MKLGLLVPRYGTEVLGGTEHWLRTLLEHMVADKGWHAEVFTSCAVSAATWADHYPAGTVPINGVNVHRYPSKSGRDATYLKMLGALRASPGSLTDDEAHRLVELVGPVNPDAVEHAVDSECDVVAVTPYLYWPAVHGVPRLGRRVVFHGAAHDEPELHLGIMKEVFESVGGLSFNSFAERDLVGRMFRVGHLPSTVLGNAVVEGSGDADQARAALGLAPDERFVLCVGRVERAKGSHLLADLWAIYRCRRPQAPRLVFVGPVHDPLGSSADVVVAGAQPEEVKWGAYSACEISISPSAWESFSLVVVESWLAHRPVLVNGRCDSTVEHCRRSGGGLWFDQYADFEVAVDRLLSDPALAAELAGRGEEYARREFNWAAITDRYEALVSRILTSFPAARPG